MPTYPCSDGTRVSQQEIDRRIRLAKKKVLERQLEIDGFNSCVQCGRSSGTFLDCSHKISVKKCKEIGKSELCYDEKNIEVLCRECHQERDKLNLKFTSNG